MKNVVVIAILLSFVLISVFGYTAVHNASQHGEVKCITEQMEGAQCPDARNPFAIADFHLSALKTFSIATVGEGGFGLTVGLAILLAAVFFAVMVAISFPAVKDLTYAAKLLENLSPVYSQTKSYHWLALHENSPNLRRGRE